MIFLDDDDTRRFALPFNPEEEGEYEYSNLVVVVVILVVKIVVIVPQKACNKNVLCVCVCVCVWRIKCVVFPSFCKEQNNLNKQKKKKIFVRCWNKKYEEKLAHAFLHLLYNALLYYQHNNV